MTDKILRRYRSGTIKTTNFDDNGVDEVSTGVRRRPGTTQYKMSDLVEVLENQGIPIRYN